MHCVVTMFNTNHWYFYPSRAQVHTTNTNENKKHMILSNTSATWYHSLRISPRDCDVIVTKTDKFLNISSTSFSSLLVSALMVSLLARNCFSRLRRETASTSSKGKYSSSRRQTTFLRAFKNNCKIEQYDILRNIPDTSNAQNIGLRQI